MSIIHDPALHELRQQLRGYVYDPGEPSTTRPARSSTPASSVARATSSAARAPTTSPPRSTTRALRDLRVAVRAGGHSVAGLSLVDDGIVIDVRGFREITVDPERRVVRAGAGLTWAELDAATQAHGLATVGGRVSSTGVAGLALGGGSGWLERKHGLACDNILAVELVTARGDEVRASADEHPELFWALRGGGGNFGVVTAIEFALHPVGPEVLGGLAAAPGRARPRAAARFRDVMHDAPDELSLAFVYLTAPDEDGIPAALRGRPAVAIAGMHAGPIDGGRARARAAPRVRAARARRVRAGRATPTSSARSTTRPATATGGPPSTSTTSSEDAIEAIAALSEELPPGPAQIFIPAWGGAVARVPAGATPLAKRDARYVVHPLLLWEDAAEDERMIAYGRR